MTDSKSISPSHIGAQGGAGLHCHSPQPRTSLHC